jgi:serine/threonine-protein kinase
MRVGRIAYVLWEEAKPLQVYVRSFAGPGGNWLISPDGGFEPLWARDGKQLYYRSKDGKQVWVADVRTDGIFLAGKPRLLFDTPGFDGGVPIRSWDISPDGRRFAMVKLGTRQPQPVTELILVQNWFEELRRLCPTEKN